MIVYRQTGFFFSFILACGVSAIPFLLFSCAYDGMESMVHSGCFDQVWGMRLDTRRSRVETGRGLRTYLYVFFGRILRLSFDSSSTSEESLSRLREGTSMLLHRLP